MAQYGLQIYDRFGEFPQQIVLYFGEEPLRMPPTLVVGGLSFQYRLVNVLELDGDWLIESDAIGDNIVGMLARVGNRGKAVGRVLHRIAKLPAEERLQAVSRLMILAGLRSQLTESIVAETKKMPTLSEIRDHPFFGREYKRGLQDGERTVLRRQIEKRFGSIPVNLETRLDALSTAELEELSVRLLDASSLEGLLGS